MPDGRDSEPDEKPKPSLVKRVMAKLGLDPMILKLMLKWVFCFCFCFCFVFHTR